MKYHITKDGRKIKLSDLEHDHLKNIIRWIERTADRGLTIEMGGGSDPEDMWYDEYTYYAGDVLRMLNYYDYKAELRRREDKFSTPAIEWIDVSEKLPDVKPADGFGEYYESEIVLVAFNNGGRIMYEVAKFTKGRDTVEGEFWESWYVPQADDVVVNVVAWLPFKPYSQ